MFRFLFLLRVSNVSFKNSHMQIFLYVSEDPASINFFVCCRLPANTFFQLSLVDWEDRGATSLVTYNPGEGVSL